MKSTEIQLMALVNSLVGSALPNPENPEPAGPWEKWIRAAILKKDRDPLPWLEPGPLPDPWNLNLVSRLLNDYWWQVDHPGPPPHWSATIAALSALVAPVGDTPNPFGTFGKPRPNWEIAALLSALVSLNPQPLPPAGPDIGFAKSLAVVAWQQALQAEGEQGGNLLRKFAEDWCGTMILIPVRPKIGEPGEPRPPRPQESLVLGAQLVHAARFAENAGIKEAAEEAGHMIFGHGLAAMEL